MAMNKVNKNRITSKKFQLLSPPLGESNQFTADAKTLPSMTQVRGAGIHPDNKAS